MKNKQKETEEIGNEKHQNNIHEKSDQVLTNSTLDQLDNRHSKTNSPIKHNHIDNNRENSAQQNPDAEIIKFHR